MKNFARCIYLWAIVCGLVAVTASAVSAALVAQVTVPIVMENDWAPEETEDQTQSVVWGDIDGDGDLDLAVGSRSHLYPGHFSIQIYLNVGGRLNDEPEQVFAEDEVMSLAWGDLDGDGDLDLVAGIVPYEGYVGGQNRAYRNVGGALEMQPFWVSSATDATHSVALGDVDGDGDLDLVEGNCGSPNVVYRNDGLNQDDRLRFEHLLWTDAVSDTTTSVALGDVDGDGQLDLVVGNSDSSPYCAGSHGVATKNNKLYLGSASGLELETTPAWISDEEDDTMSVALGDVDGDDDLDLAVGNDWAENRVYLNRGGRLETTASWASIYVEDTYAVALGDVDGDGDLDLATGEHGLANQLYLNLGARLQITPTWVSDSELSTTSIAWGDVDGDGDLDLAAGNDDAVNSLYIYENLNLAAVSSWEQARSMPYNSLAWGDVDGDRDLDLVVGSGHNASEVYLNLSGRLADTPAWSQALSGTQSLAWGDADGDGDLDLAVGLGMEGGTVYRNDGVTSGVLHLAPVWHTIGRVEQVAWGDMDGDGYLDLAVAHWEAPDEVYHNVGGQDLLEDFPLWRSEDADVTSSLAWGDVDGDGDLDLATATINHSNRLYLNNDGTLERIADWYSDDGAWTTVVAWGDVDGDGDLDLAAGNIASPDVIYFNEDGSLHEEADWASKDRDRTVHLAWADADGDGDLDLATAGNNTTRVYLNTDDGLQNEASWRVESSPWALAWGDVEGDGDLDLAITDSDGLKLYLNGRPSSPYHTNAPVNIAIQQANHADFYAASTLHDNGIIPFTYTLFHPTGVPMQAISGSYSLDGGGKWLPATATSDTITRNLATGHLLSERAQQGLPLDLPDEDTITASLFMTTAHAIADLDVWLTISHTFVNNLEAALIAPDGTRVSLFANVGEDGQHFNHTLFSDQATTSIMTTTATPPYTGTYRPKGPLSVLNGQSTAGEWQLQITDSSAFVTGTLLGWGLRIATAGPSHVYTWDVFNSDFFGQSDNVVFRLLASPLAEATKSSVPNTYGYTRTIPGPYQRSSVTAQTYPLRVRGNQVRVMSDTTAVADAIVYRLPSGQNTGATAYIRATGEPLTTDNHGYLQGRGEIALGDTLVALAPTGSEATVTCQTYDSTDVPKTIIETRPSVTTSTLTIADSTEIVDINIVAISGTHTYFGDLEFLLESPEKTSVHLMRPSCDAADGDFYLSLDDEARGRWPCPPDEGGIYRPTESLAAFVGEESQGTWTLTVRDHAHEDGGTLYGWGIEICSQAQELDQHYYTNAPPNDDGLDGHRVTQRGVQTLTVSSENPLLLFNLDISLEWDARQDTAFLDQLDFDLRRASELLFDATDGQAALGALTIYHNQARWDSADVRIYASNTLIPNADVGGLVSRNTPEVISTNPYAIPALTPPYTITYRTGKVSMGVQWSRYGEADGILGEDWPRALVHELGHYLFYLYDNYIGLDDEGLITSVSRCGGSMMSNPYTYDEFRARDATWASDCAATLSARRNGRADWETITTFYPQLHTGQLITGPAALPLEVTQIAEVQPSEETAMPLEAFIFTLTDEYGAARQPDEGAQAVLYQESRLINLGQPEVDKVTARGAREGDRLCVYELDADPPRLGCETLEIGDVYLALAVQEDWQPEILVTPISSATISVTVRSVAGGLPLQARLYVDNGSASDIITLNEIDGEYRGSFTLTDPSTQGYILVWVNEPETERAPRREMLTNYALGGSATCPRSCPPGDPGRCPLASSRQNFKPAISPDGQVLLYGDFTADEGFYTLQRATQLPDLPLWTTVVGHGYYVLKTVSAPPIEDASITFRYRRQDVPAGEEAFLHIYYWTGNEWRKLPTTQVTGYNEVSAPGQGAGLYALMSTLEIPLHQAGWNLVAYPVQETREVTEALASIEGAYALVYGYVVTDTRDPWKLYTPPQSDGRIFWGNDLHTMTFGRGYWISATRVITWQLKGADATTTRVPVLHMPPATYYGVVSPTTTFTPLAGMPITATVNGRACAYGQTQQRSDAVGYAINVGYNPRGGICGTDGATVTFIVGNVEMEQEAPWNNHRLIELALSARPVTAIQAADDIITTTEDVPILIDVLRNDTGVSLTLKAVSQPTYGQATPVGTSTVTYTPTRDFYGAETFTYTVQDQDHHVDTARVYITVTPFNDAPTISDIPDQNTEANKPIGPIPFVVNDVDNDVNTLTLRADSSNQALIASPTIRFSGSGPSRTLHLTPTYGTVGSTCITVTVRDVEASTQTDFPVIVSSPAGSDIFLPLVLREF